LKNLTITISFEITGAAKNFDGRGPKLEKNCDAILVTFFVDVMVKTSLKWRHNYIVEVQLCHNQLKKTLFGQTRNFRSPILKVKGRWGRKAPSAWRFLKMYY